MTLPVEPQRIVCALHTRQAKPARKGFGDAEEFERELTSCFAAGVACEPFVPTETEMRPLAPCEYNRWCRSLGQRDDGLLHAQMLVARHPSAGSPLFPTGPVIPEEWGRAACTWMQEYAHSAGMLGLVSMPLTLQTLLAPTTVGNPGLVHDTEAAISLLAAFLGKERIPGRATHGSVRLERKVLT